MPIKDSKTKPTTNPGKSSSEEAEEFIQRSHVAFYIIDCNTEPQLRGILEGCSEPAIA